MRLTVGRMHRAAFIGAATCALTIAGMASSVDWQPRNYDIAAQDLGHALRALAEQSGLQLAANGDLVQGKQSLPLKGSYTAEQALHHLLEGSGLTGEISDGTVIVGGRFENPAPGTAGSDEGSKEIVVTGTRIRGRAPASPLISLSQQEIHDRGFNDLGEAIRSLPDNFSGGQNPTVAEGSGGRNNENLNGSSSLNLRGLGADATLTLVNGHRLAYDGVFQGVDIGAIPLAAVDRLEIVPDGASALYGSDAVGGVANVILKRDFQGLDTSARVGGSTDGGNFQQEYDAVTGSRWSNGGFIASAGYSRSTEISADQRSYTAALDPSSTIIPKIKQFNAIVSGHQFISDGITFEADALYSARHSISQIPYSADGPASTYGISHSDKVRTFSVAPKLTFELPRNWTATLSGVYSTDNSTLRGVTAYPGEADTLGRINDDNQLGSVEGTAEGPLFALPGGLARLAIGAGYRKASFHQLEAQGPAGAEAVTQETRASRENEYGFAELSLPFIGPEQGLAGLYRLTANAAVRYESYPGMAHLARPKLGLIYQPVRDVTFKTSWGKSFKTPTLLEQYSTRGVQAIPAFIISGASFPPTATTLFVYGANANLKPEKATTWTSTVEITPTRVPGLKMSVDYFRISYRDRVVNPITSLDGLYSDPTYANFVTLNPTSAQVSAAIASATQPFENITGGVFDPTSVVAIINSVNVNATRQKISGVDAGVTYERDLPGGSHLNLQGSATYLRSRQQFTPGQPWVSLAGTIYNPSHWRANASLGWAGSSLGFTGAMNYVGGVVDNRSAVFYSVRSMTTFDLTASWKPQAPISTLKNITLRLSILNIFNRKPAIIHESADYIAPFDSTNYSAIGRFVGLTVDKVW